MNENIENNNVISENETLHETAPKKRTRKTKQERLAEIAEQKRMLIEKEKKLEAEIKKDNRKARTKHLIEMGGAFAKILSDLNISEEDAPAVLAFLKQQEASGSWVSKAVAKSKIK